MDVKKWWRLLLYPVTRAIWWYLGYIVVRELVRLGGNYSMSATLRFLEFLKGNGGGWAWAAFLGALALYFEVALRLNGRTLWYMTKQINAPLYKHMRSSALRKFLELPVGWHQRHNSAALVGEINNGIDRVYEIVDAAGWEFVPLIAGTLLSVAPLLWLSPVSMLVLCVTGTAFILLNYRIYVKSEPYRIAKCDWQREDWQLSTECIRGLPAVLMANRSGHAREEYERIQDEIARNTIEEYRCEVFRHGRWRDRVVSWTHVGLIGIWLHQMQNGTLTLVDCVYLWRICEDILVYLEGYSALFEQVANNMEPVKRYLGFLEEKTEERCAPETAVAEPDPESVRIEVRGLSFHYHGQARCLDGINLTVSPGELVGIVGSTGSGKSTLAKVLCRLFEPNGGEVLMNGRSAVDGWPAEQVRRMISYVPQLNEAHVFARSIADNIRFAAPDAPMEKVIEAAKIAGLHEDVMNLPQEYETVVGESGCTLSGGQVQRLLIAREVLKDAPVFILDEATSAQDVLTERRILGALRPRLERKAAIVISHRLAPVRALASRILVMEGGRIVEEGAPGELMRIEGRFFRMATAGRRRSRSRETAGVR